MSVDPVIRLPINSQSINPYSYKQNDGTVLTPNDEDGILFVDAYGVPTFDGSHVDFHDYDLDNSCSKAKSGFTIENLRNG